MTAYLDLADYLLIAEAVLGVPAELIADFHRIGLADSALAAPSPMPAQSVDPRIDKEREYEAIEGAAMTTPARNTRMSSTSLIGRQQG